jgi:tripartite-type tricarboxylate transporter receptor subunit TctC
VVVPFPAGGPSDVVAHIVTDEMAKILGQSMVIENVGGAGGTIGSARVAQAQPDGYTLLAGSMGSHVAAPVLTPNVKYDSAAEQTATEQSSGAANPCLLRPRDQKSKSK